AARGVPAGRGGSRGVRVQENGCRAARLPGLGARRRRSAHLALAAESAARGALAKGQWAPEADAAPKPPRNGRASHTRKISPRNSSPDTQKMSFADSMNAC